MQNNNEEQQVQELIDDYKNAVLQKHRAEQLEKNAIEAIKEHCEGIEGKTITLIGVDTQMKIRPRENATYKKERGKTHPLKKLLDKYPELDQMVRIGYTEAGSKIKNLISEYTDPNHGSLTPDQIALVEDVLKHRQTSEGKPSIEITTRVDNDAITE